MIEGTGDLMMDDEPHQARDAAIYEFLAGYPIEVKAIALELRELVLSVESGGQSGISARGGSA